MGWTTDIGDPCLIASLQAIGGAQKKKMTERSRLTPEMHVIGLLPTSKLGIFTIDFSVSQRHHNYKNHCPFSTKE
jgi:hypothetical protein